MRKGKRPSILDTIPKLKGTEIAAAIDAVVTRHQVTKQAGRVPFKVFAQMSRFARAIGATNFEQGGSDYDCEKFEGLKVLDVACGSPKAFAMLKRINKSREMEPWFCRALAQLKADVTGVDLFYPTYKKRGGRERGVSESGWTFVQRDLFEPGALDTETFPNNSFDAVHCRSFMLGTLRNQDDPRVSDLREEDPVRYQTIVMGIYDRIQDVLKEGGIFLLNDDKFTKMDGVLELHENFNQRP